MERVRFMEHRGKEVLLIEFCYLDPGQMLAVVDRVRELITAQPRDSVLVLADYTGAKMDRQVATRIREVLVFDRPFVRRAAWVGVQHLPDTYYESFRRFSLRDFPTFTSREEALEWLVSDQPHALASPA
jgi:hypothetical protein